MARATVPLGAACHHYEPRYVEFEGVRMAYAEAGRGDLLQEDAGDEVAGHIASWMATT